MRIVSFFNHKGGVGKTTLIYNVGLALASSGHKVLFVDLDPQANLTSAALDATKLEQVLSDDQTIHACLLPTIEGSGDIASIDPIAIRNSAWILPGSILLSEFEEISPQGWTETLAGNVRGFRASTAVYRVVKSAAEMVDADFAFLDLGPNVGSLNRTAILGSDGFVVPLAPDLFSLSALPSVGKSVALWIEDWRSANEGARRRSLNIEFALPNGLPVPLGYISQQFSVYRQAPTNAYKRWIERIPGAYESGIIEPLRKAGVSIPTEAPKIGEVRNLSSLIPMAQRTNQAVFELSGVDARGSQYTRARDTYKLFEGLAKSIESRVNSSRK